MERYDKLITRVYDKLDGKNDYPDEEKYHDFFINNTEYERLEEHNLWTYWQGRNVRNPKIMIVGQDWGSIEQSRKYYEYIKNNPNEPVVCFEQIQQLGCYEDKEFTTDRELVKLVSMLGDYSEICTKSYADLYFTNLIPGYRNSISSTGKASEAKKGVTKGVMKDFRTLLEILQPKVIICLGRLVSESIAGEFGHKRIIKDAGSFNKFLDKELNKDNPQPIELELGNGHHVVMFTIAHLGNLGRNNRRSNFKNEDIKNMYPEADWKVVAEYIKGLKL